MGAVLAIAALIVVAAFTATPPGETVVVVPAPDVPAEKIAELPPVFIDVEHHLARAKNVPRIPERHRHAIQHRKGTIVIDAYELPNRLFGIDRAVKRLDWRQALFRPLL